MPWRLTFTRRAEQDLDGVPASDQIRIRERLDHLTDDPGSTGIIKLAGREREWRLRVGRWRVRLELDNDAGQIRVLRVLRRDEGTYRR